MKANGRVMVEDEEDEDDVAGPELPPKEDEGEADEEGRFFGGGITTDTAEVLDFIEERDKDQIKVCIGLGHSQKQGR